MALRILAHKFSLNKSLSMMGLRLLSSDGGSGKGPGMVKGGGPASAGGGMGKRQWSQEEQYFRQKEAAMMSDVKKDVLKEIKFHEEQIKVHQKALDRIKDKLKKYDD